MDFPPRAFAWVPAVILVSSFCACDDAPPAGAADAGADAEVSGDAHVEDSTPPAEDAPSAVDAGPQDSGPPPVCVTLGSEFPLSVVMPNADANGSYDPSLERDPTTGRLWMAYSGVDGPAGSGRVNTHLAYSDDDGMTWCHQALVNLAEAVSREEQPASIAQEQAHWNHETPSLVYDPEASPDARWLLMWARYLHIEDDTPGNEDRHFEHGWVAGRRAATPEALADAPEFKLFSAQAYHADPAVEAYNDAVAGGLPEMRWDGHPELRGCVAFAEASAMADEGKLYVAIPCPRVPGVWDIAIIAYSHESETWSHVGSVLPQGTEVEGFENISLFNGPDLVRSEAGEPRLLVTPVDETGAAYNGCVGFPIELATGTLTSAASYALHRSEGAGIYQSGPCTYEADSVLGVLSGDVHFSGVQFELVATGDVLP